MRAHALARRPVGRTASLAAVVIAALAVTGAADAQVRVAMTADRSAMSLDEQLTVRIEVEAEGGGSPEVELPGFAGFQVVSQQVQRPMQFSFSFGGRAVVRSSTNYTFGLRAASVGRLRIDPVRVTMDGRVYASQPIEVNVATPGGAVQAPAGASPPTGAPPAAAAQPGTVIDAANVDDAAFVRTVVDKPEPYVGEQVTVTIYLYVRQQLRAAPGVLQEPGTEGFWTRDLLSPDQNLQPQRQVVRGAVYAVYVLRRFAAFPLRDGALAIGAMSLRIDQSSIFDMFAGQGPSVLERNGVTVPVRVRSLPDAGKPAGDVAVGRFEISAALDRDRVATGDAATLKATVRGEGNLSGVRIANPVIAGVDVLQPETRDLVESPQDLVTGTRTYAWLLVPRAEGVHTIPPLVLHTFDPRSERYQELTTPALTLQAAGQAIATPSAAPEAAPADATPAPTARATATAVEWPPIRTHSELRRREARLVESPAYAWSLAFPPLAWLALVVTAALRRRVAARAARPDAMAAREAQRHLASAEQAARRGDAAAFHAAASAALGGVLRARMGAEAAGWTRSELREALVRRGADAEFAQSIVAQLDHWDYARFGSTDAAALDTEVGTLRGLFRRVEALTLTTEAAS